MDGFNTASKIDLRYSEQKIVFTICDCSLDKKYSFYYGLNRETAEKFIDKLKHFELYEWRQLSGLDRKHGLTTERPGTDSYNMIDSQNNSPEKLTGEKYYFHFRIEQTGKFRVFGYQKKQFFCITHIDYKGQIHHD